MTQMHLFLSSDNAYACDPRIIKFREEEKERKNAVKRARQEAARQKIEEEERVKLNLFIMFCLMLLFD